MEPTFPWISQKYAYSYATKYFYDALESYRADNIKELINSFEEFLYRERMVDSQNEIIQLQRESNIIAKQNYYVNLANLNELRNQTQVIQNESQNIRDTVSKESQNVSETVTKEAQKTRSFINEQFKDNKRR